MNSQPPVLTDPDIVEDVELTKAINEAQQNQIDKHTALFFKKNKRELKRLEEWAKTTLIEGNKEGYIYAIRKLRAVTGKSVSEDVLETLYETSRDEVLKIIRSYSEAKSSL